MVSIYTATQIADFISAAAGHDSATKANVQNRVRYLAKKGHLLDGKQVDQRGTLKFSKIEVFRAALYCELLAASMDIKSVKEALDKAQNIHPLDGVHPESARIKGGWTYADGGLGAAVRGVAAGEIWKLALRVKRPGNNDAGGLSARYTWSGQANQNVDSLVGRKPTALTIEVDLNVLFKDLIDFTTCPEK